MKSASWVLARAAMTCPSCSDVAGLGDPCDDGHDGSNSVGFDARLGGIAHNIFGPDPLGG